MKIIYIAGPLTSNAPTEQPARREFIANNVKKAESYQIALANAGIGCFCSHTHTTDHHIKGSTASEEYYYELGLEFLKRCCDAVLAMPGWEQSRGSQMEITLAKDNNLPIFYPGSPDDIEEIINWANN